MASLETVLKIKDQFSAALNKMSGSVRHVAEAGRASGQALSASMEYSGQAFGRAGAFIDGVGAQFEKLKSRLSERIEPEYLADMKESYSEMAETLTTLGTKYSAQIGLINSWKSKVSELQNEYNRLKTTGNTTGAGLKLDELNRAKLQMANLRISANKTGAAIDKMREPMKLMEQEIDKTKKGQRLFNQAIRLAQDLASGVKNAFSGVTNTVSNVKSRITDMLDSAKAKMGGGLNVGGLIKGFMGFAAIKKGIEQTLGAGGRLINQVKAMEGMFGNADVGRAYFNSLKAYASESGQSMDGLMNVTKSFLSFTRNTDQLMALNNIAEKLSFKNTDQGIEGAGYAINEALSGQFESLRNRFNMSTAQIEPIKKAIAKGNFEGITMAFNEALAGAGITDSVIDSMRNTVPNQFNAILNDIKMGFAGAGMGAMDNLLPVLNQFRALMDSESGGRFFEIIGNGLSIITGGFSWLGQAVMNNWSIISPILTALGIAAAVVGAVMFASWVLSMAPLFAVIALIGVFVSRLNKLGVSTEHIISFIGGLFGVLGSTVGNVFIGIWNIAVDVAEFLANVFIDPGYAIQKLFYNVTITVLGFFDNMVQGIVSAINWVIEKINQVSGSDMQKVEVNFISKWIDNLEAKSAALTSGKNVADYSDMKLDLISGGDSFTKGNDLGVKLFNTVTDGFDGFMANENAWNAAQNANLESISADTGKISNSVDIGSEQLKYLRDIAEREAINLFTSKTLVPQLQVTIENVNETADVDGVIKKIVEEAEEAFDIGEEGVHK